jgi:hypothetical protein
MTDYRVLAGLILIAAVVVAVLFLAGVVAEAPR